MAASAVLLALAVYTHYYAVFLLPAQFVVVLIAATTRHSTLHTPRSTLLTWLIAAACILALLAPWLLIASAGFAYDDGFFFPLNTIDGRLLEWVRGFAGGGLVAPLPEWWWLALGLAALLGALGFGFMANKRWRELLVVIALIAAPLLAATIAVRVAYPYRSVFHPRYLIYVAPMVCVLFGGAFSLSQRAEHPCGKSARMRESRGLWASFAFGGMSLAVLGALWLPPLLGYFTDPAMQREDTRQATKHVVEALAPGDAVVMSRDNFAVRYYWPRVWRQIWAADYDPLARMLLAAPDGLHGILTDDESVLAKLNEAPRKRVRLMLWQDDVVDPQKFVESSLWPNGFELGEYNFAQIRLPLYQVDASPIMPPQFKAMDATFGDQLTLRSAWQRERGVAGDWFYAVLNWEPLTQLDKNYKVFVHVLDGDGKPAFQNDKLPLNALLPMTRWAPGQPLRDAHAMVIPADLPAGIYRVVAGVYDPATGQRLLTQDGQDHATLGAVEVVRP